MRDNFQCSVALRESKYDNDDGNNINNNNNNNIKYNTNIYKTMIIKSITT
jgi:hypothetical protein